MRYLSPHGSVAPFTLCEQAHGRFVDPRTGTLCMTTGDISANGHDRGGGVLQRSRLRGTLVEIGGEEFALLEWSTPPSSSAPRLSQAEAEVARLVSCGASNAAIAAARGRGLGTIAKQVSSVFRKLGVRCRSELYAKAAGTQDPPDGALP